MVAPHLQVILLQPSSFMNFALHRWQIRIFAMAIFSSLKKNKDTLHVHTVKHTYNKVPVIEIFLRYKCNLLYPSSLIHVIKLWEWKSLHCRHQFIISVITITVFYCSLLPKQLSISIPFFTCFYIKNINLFALWNDQ